MQIQGGNVIADTARIAIRYQHKSCAVFGRPAGRFGEPDILVLLPFSIFRTIRYEESGSQPSRIQVE